MARIIQSPPGGTPPNAFEQHVLDIFQRKLPREYQLLPNFILKPSAHQNAVEIDIVVLTTHAIYVVECKEWFGRITGDDTEWLLNDRHSKAWPMNMTEYKCKVLKSFLGAKARRVKVEPVFVVPDRTTVQLTGNWRQHCNGVLKAVDFLQNASLIGVQNANIKADLHTFVNLIQGKWGSRIRGPRKKVGGYKLDEAIHQEPGSTTYLAHQSLVSDPNPYRVRVWSISSQLSEEDRNERLNLIRRPTEAVAQIGSHPNLLRVLQFDEMPNEFAFYEVTEWSEFGTLHGYIRNTARPQLTVRERLEIASGIVSALVAVHSKGVVHRNICPETILIGFDLQPRLTDFDRAYLKRESAKTVFAATEARNLAYLPPELADRTDYDFSYTSDLYCFGVLLYELLTGEVPFQNPQEAAEKGGVPEQLPSDVRGNVSPEVDELVLNLLRIDDFNARPSAEDALEVLNKVLKGTTNNSQKEQPSEFTKEPKPLIFEPGEIIAQDYKLEGEIGQGSFSKVYKVQHMVQGKYYAMKVLIDAEQADVMFREFGTGDLLPQHPNIAAIKWLAHLPPPDNTPYILSEFVDGEKLKDYCNGKKKLPLSEIRRIAIALLSALTAIHPKTARMDELANKTCTKRELEELEKLKKSGILHRDIKPDNILLDNHNDPKIIDFNIAVIANQASGKAGTPRYWAPDRGQPEWAATDDLFSLGVVLYELVTHRHPYANNTPGNGEPFDPLAIAPELNISQEFASFLLKAVQPSRNQRFLQAAEMQAELEEISSLHAPIPTGPTQENFDDLTLDPDEEGRKDYNPYVTRLLTLFSQAKRSNAGTRGLDDIARLTYVETKLDTELAPAILDGKFRLVIVTGNAGDGKTAFLQQLESQFSQQGIKTTPIGSGNGAEWHYQGVSYSSNYDGSQDEGDLENDTVLANFLSPFKGKSLVGLSESEARIIAINEGRLLDFLEHSPLRKDFEGLRIAVQKFFLEGQAPPSGMLVVNLNLRAVAAGGNQSLVERQLNKMLQPQIWAPCQACRINQKCPLKANADTLRDESSGTTVKARVRRLFEVVHLRRQKHVTMRDLRSALSYFLLRDHSCSDIARLVNAENANERLISLYYTEAFSQEDASITHAAQTQTTDDRLVKLLREVDVGQVDAPNLDRKLAFNEKTALPWLIFENRSSYIDDVYDSLRKRTSDPTETGDIITVLNEQRRLLRTLRRRAYFERRDEKWRKMLPYRSLELIENVTLQKLEEQTDHPVDNLKNCIIEAISLLEGVRHPTVRGDYICLRASQVKNASALSFRLFPKEDFILEVEDRSAASQYLELAPDTVTLRHKEKDRASISLRLSLDLLEMLDMVRHGYRPNMNDMGGLFVNLIIFRNALLHIPYNAVLVTKDDETFFRISAEISDSSQVSLHVQPQIWQEVERSS